MSQSHIEAHVDLIAKHEQEFLAKRTSGERLGDRIAAWVGSFTFVILHVCFFVLWIMWNHFFSSTRQFDPYPFSLLGTVVAMEGIILASFILMRQARMARRADERDHLMLQILLLTEKEITAVLKVDRQIAAQVGAEKWEPFFTTKAPVGSGLGLWVTREVLTKREAILRLCTSTQGSY